MPRFSRVLLALLLLEVVALLVWRLVAYAQLAVALLQFPYQVMEAEGLLVAMGLDLVSGRSPYRDPAQPPWILAVYPPLFAWMSGLVASVVGVSASAARVVSLVATAGCLVVIVWFIRREVVSLPGSAGSGWTDLIAVVSGATYLGSPYVFEWSPLGRVDMLTLLFALLAIGAAYHSDGGSRGRWLAVSGICCVLSLWTKQSSVAAPAAICLWLLLHRRLNSALLFGASVGSVTLLGYAALDLWSGGAFVQSTIAANALPWWPRTLANYWRRTLLLYGWLLAGAAAFVWFTVRRRRPSLLVVYLLIAAATTLTAGHTGAAMNYFLEMLAAAAICSGIMLAHTVSFPAQRQLESVMAAGLALQIAWFSLADASPVAEYLDRSSEWGFAPRPEHMEAAGRIERLVRERGGDVLSEDPVLNLRAGSPVVAVPSSSFRALADNGYWMEGERGLVESIRDQRYRTIVLTKGTYPVAVLEAIDARYLLIDEAPTVGIGYRVFVPAGH